MYKVKKNMRVYQAPDDGSLIRLTKKEVVAKDGCRPKDVLTFERTEMTALPKGVAKARNDYRYGVEVVRPDGKIFLEFMADVVSTRKEASSVASEIRGAYTDGTKPQIRIYARVR